MEAKVPGWGLGPVRRVGEMTESTTEPLSFRVELNAFTEVAHEWPGELAGAFSSAFTNTEVVWPLVLAVMLIVGLAGERLMCRKLNSMSRTLREQQSTRWLVTFGVALLRTFFEDSAPQAVSSLLDATAGKLDERELDQLAALVEAARKSKRKQKA